MRIAQDEHSVEIVIPVTGNLIKFAFCHKRSLCEYASSLLLFVFYPSLKYLYNARAFGKHNGESLTDNVYRCEISEIASELVMVALFCFLCHGEIFGELIFCGE